jgi:tetratricopeptide (TPR) repeat protein
LLEAALASVDGRPDETRRILEAERAVRQAANAHLLGILADAAERTEQWAERVELLTELIDLAWIDNEALVPWVEAHFELGESLERSGRPRDAIPHYTRFLELWGDANEELPVLEEARRRIAAIEGSGGR